ncbi:hypothetical protein MD484_g8454, partial [Candolleomyces efflorescens]
MAEHVPPQPKLADILDTLQGCRQALERVDAARVMIMEIIDASEALLAPPPVHSIPEEVFQEIFQYCLPTDHLPILSSSEAPISLTQVCRLWRTLALSSPRLWAAVHIPVPSARHEAEFHPAFSMRLGITTWWLKNACRSPYPLTVSLYWPKALPLRYTQGKREYFARAVIAASHNLRELDLDLPYDNLNIILNQPPESFPRLEKVTLRRGTREIENARLWGATSLRRVVWDGVGADILRTMLKWDVMEEIRVVGDSDRSWFKYEDATKLLQATRKTLTHVSLQLAEINDDANPRVFSPTLLEAIQGTRTDASVDTPLLLPQLQSLDVAVDTCKPHFLPRLWQRLQLPTLRTLIYATCRTAPCRHSQLESHPLTTLLSGQRQPTTITTLIINADSMSTADFFGCLKLLPSLERLCVLDGRLAEVETPFVEDLGRNPLEEIVIDNGLLEGLLTMPSRSDGADNSLSILCPLLTHLRFDLARFSLDCLEDLIHTRLALAASSTFTPTTATADEVTRVAKLQSVQGVLVDRTNGGWDQSDFRSELGVLGVSVDIKFLSDPHPNAGNSQNIVKVGDPRDGLRPVDEWTWL